MNPLMLLGRITFWALDALLDAADLIVRAVNSGDAHDVFVVDPLLEECE